MTIYLPVDGNDTAAWELTHAPDGTPQVELESAWHNVTVSVDGLTISIPVAGVNDLTPPSGAVIITRTQRPRIRVGGIIRTAGSIILRTS